MLIVRRPQIRALSDPFRRAFEGQLVAFVVERFPKVVAALSPEKTVRAVQDAIERAEDLGLEADRHIQTYATILFSFGEDFNRNPGLPWAREIVAMGRPLRIDLLHAAAIEHLGEARGLIVTRAKGSSR